MRLATGILRPHDAVPTRRDLAPADAWEGGGPALKIGVLCHYFWPETGAPTARLLETAWQWRASGHEVTVVTNFPNHPTGVIPEPYGGRSFMEEEVEGIRVIRCRTYATPNRGFARRTLGHLVFMIQCLRQAAPALREADVLIASSPTLFAVVSAWILSRRLGVPFVFEVRDLWPAIFVDLGVIRNRVVIRLLEALEMFLYRRSAAVVTVTEAFAQDIRGRGIEAGKVHVIPNGVDPEAFRPVEPDPELRRAGRFVVLYCGAHGISHGLHRILEVAARLQAETRFQFVFVGDGTEKDRLVAEAQARGLGNVTFLGTVPRARVPHLYCAADACLVPLRDLPLFEGFIPSKIFEILGCGRPIVASLRGEAARILEASGGALVVPPEDVEAIAGALRRLAEDPGLRTSLTGCGRSFACLHYNRRALAARYAEILSRLRMPAAAPPSRSTALHRTG